LINKYSARQAHQSSPKDVDFYQFVIFEPLRTMRYINLHYLYIYLSIYLSIYLRYYGIYGIYGMFHDNSSTVFRCLVNKQTYWCDWKQYFTSYRRPQRRNYTYTM